MTDTMTSSIEDGTRIENVGLLDIRSADPEVIQNISYIGNIGTILYSRQTAALLSQLRVENLGSTVEASESARLITSSITFNRDYFKHNTEGQELVIAGRLVVHPDVQPEDLDEGIAELHIAGRVICPENLVGALQSKITSLAGRMVIYAQDSQLIDGSLTLDEKTLNGLDDESALVVTGTLVIPDIVDNDLLSRKLERIQVLGTIRCHEKNAEVLSRKQGNNPAKLTVIPNGFALMTRPLLLDANLLAALPARKLYCTDRILIDADVDPTLLDEKVDALRSEDMIVAPTGLGEVLGRKCNLLETRVLFYEGELWVIDGESLLQPARLDYLADRATLLVTGELRIGREVDPAALAQRMAKIHNFGEIYCNAEQMGAVQARMGADEGELIDISEVDPSGAGISNIGYLKL